MNRILSIATNLFPIWVLGGGVLALVHPNWFTWFSGDFITWGLAVIMLGMGITLSIDDFKAVLKMPRAVGIGFVAHYAIMPLLGWSIARLLRLETPFAVGLILVACCPCGTASNVVNYIARSNVALSVLTTMCSTLGAIVMTPLLTKWLAGTYVPVPAWGLFLSTVKIVLAPVIIGVALNRCTPRFVKFILPVSPLVSVLTITLICASIIGSSADDFKKSGGELILAVFLLHTGGFFSWLRCQPATALRRTHQPHDFSGGGHAKFRLGSSFGEGTFRANAAGRAAVRNFGDVSFGHRQPARGRLAVASGFAWLRCDRAGAQRGQHPARDSARAIFAHFFIVEGAGCC